MVDIDQYMNGYCMFMAAAIHHKYKLPIGLMTVEGRLSHAWIELPDGNCFDIEGIKTIEQIMEYSDNVRVYRNITLRHLEELSGTKLEEGDEEVKIALDVVQNRSKVWHDLCNSGRLS